jgi:hypothetical protein
MKSFNLEEAKEGSPICTADGKEVFFVGVRKNGILLVEKCGELLNMSSHELFMKPKKRTVWVNFYQDGTCYSYSSEGAANIYGTLHTDGRICGKAYPVEIEE